MSHLRFSDGEWERIRDWRRNHPGIDVGQAAPTRLLLEAILWMARAGAQRRLLPAAFWPWDSVCQRFAPRVDQRGQETGVWQMPMDHSSAGGDLGWLMLDSTVARAHSSAAEAKKVKASSVSAAHGADFPASCTVSRTASATRSASP